MAYQASQPLKDGNRYAAVDLSDAQFRFVDLDADAAVTTSGDGAVTWGVLQNAPRQGEEVATTLIGVTKVRAGAEVSVGDAVGIDGEGRAVPGGTLGIFLLDGIADDVVTIAVNALNIQSAT